MHLKFTFLFWICIFEFGFSQGLDYSSIDDKYLKDLDYYTSELIHGHYLPQEFDICVKLDSSYCIRETYLLREVHDAFLKMAEAAAKDSIRLIVVSGIRTFDYQKEIWENKWLGLSLVDGKKLSLTHKNPLLRSLKILEYTAPPGFSRHHWGTEIDLNSVEDEYFETDEGRKVYHWLNANASSFGFCQTYPNKILSHRSGFNEEKWHWSYYKISTPILKQLKDNFTKELIRGFLGFKEVRKIDLLNKYILSINTCN